MAKIKDIIDYLNNKRLEDRLFVCYNTITNEQECTLWTEQDIIDKANELVYGDIDSSINDIDVALEYLADFDSTNYYLEIELD